MELLDYIKIYGIASYYQYIKYKKLNQKKNLKKVLQIEMY